MSLNTETLVAEADRLVARTEGKLKHYRELIKIMRANRSTPMILDRALTMRS